MPTPDNTPGRENVDNIPSPLSTPSGAADLTGINFSGARYVLLTKDDEPVENRLDISFDLARYADSFQGPERIDILQDALAREADPHVFLNLLEALGKTTTGVSKLVPFTIALLNSYLDIAGSLIIQEQSINLIEKWSREGPKEAYQALRPHMALLYWLSTSLGDNSEKLATVLDQIDLETHRHFKKWRGEIHRLSAGKSVPRISKSESEALYAALSSGDSLEKKLQEKTDKLSFLALSQHRLKAPRALEILLDTPYLHETLTLHNICHATKGREAQRVQALSEAFYVLERSSQPNLEPLFVRFATDAWNAYTIGPKYHSVLPIYPRLTAIYSTFVARVKREIPKHLTASLLAALEPSNDLNYGTVFEVPMRESLEHILSLRAPILRRGGSDFIRMLNNCLMATTEGSISRAKEILDLLATSSLPIDYFTPGLLGILYSKSPLIPDALILLAERLPERAGAWLAITRCVQTLTWSHEKALKGDATKVYELLYSKKHVRNIARNTLEALQDIGEASKERPEVLAKYQHPEDVELSWNDWRRINLNNIHGDLRQMFSEVAHRMRNEILESRTKHDQKMLKLAMAYFAYLDRELLRNSLCARAEDLVFLREIIGELYTYAMDTLDSIFPAYFAVKPPNKSDMPKAQDNKS